MSVLLVREYSVRLLMTWSVGVQTEESDVIQCLHSPEDGILHSGDDREDEFPDEGKCVTSVKKKKARMFWERSH